MSVKYQISNQDFESLDNSMVLQIVNLCQQEFKRQDYLIGRYKRTNELQANRLESDPTKANPVVTFEKRLIDTAVGYGMNKPITYYDTKDDNVKIEKRKNYLYNIESEFVKKLKDQKDGEYLDTLLKVFKNNSTYLHDVEIYKQLLITGSADEMVYTDENAEIQLAIIDDHCVALYDYSIKPKMIGFIRVSIVDSLKGQQETIYEVYTEKRAWRFSNQSDGVSTDIYYGGMNVNKIPFIRYDIKESYVENLIPLIRAYELSVTNTKNMLNYNDNALLMIRGYMTDSEEFNPNEIIQDIRKSGTLFLDGEGDTGAEWLTKNIDDNAITNHKQAVKNDIYAGAGTFDPAGDNMVYQNTLSLLFKLYNLETKTGQYLAQFKKSLTQRIKYVTNIINFSFGASHEMFNYRDIDMTFSRDIPTNLNEELQFLVQASPYISQETLYKMLSFIENPEKEADLYEKWQLKQAEIEAQKSQIISKATQDVLPYDLNYRGNDDKKDTEDKKSKDE